MNVSTNEAVKAAHDEELAKLEAEITALGKQEESGTAEEEKTSGVQSAEDETKHSEEGEEKKEDEKKPDGATSTESDDAELSDEDVKQLSAKAQKRFKHLAKLNSEMNRELAFLRKNTPKTEPAPEPKRIPLPWENEDEPDVAQIASEKARETVMETLRTERILSTIKEDVKEVEAKYPELNPNAPEYDRVLLAKVSTWYKAQFKENNELRLKDFVDEVFALRERGIEKGRQEVTGKIAKQSAEQALTPSGGRVETSSVEEKIRNARSISELEALEKSL